MSFTKQKQWSIKYGELVHLKEYLADYTRLCFQLPNGIWNTKPLSSEEREYFEIRIKQLEKELGIND